MIMTIEKNTGCQAAVSLLRFPTDQSFMKEKVPYLVVEDVGISDNPGDEGIGLNLVWPI